jgi:hypothetical protein
MDFKLNRWIEENSVAAFSVRVSHRVIETNGYMYLTGGFTSGVANSEVWKSSDGITWTPLISAPGWKYLLFRCMEFYKWIL